jgi:ADP-ribose pyrophosphatase YjhB (NUDIX family)
VTLARFCSACGAELPGRPPIRCRRCGVEHWRSPSTCANALLVRETEILLVHRAHAPWLGMWCAPGGFCNEGEHPIAAAEREILEETGLRARVTGYLGIWVCRYADDQEDADADTISVAYYLAQPLAGGAAAFDRAEVSDLRWFPLEGLPDALAPPGILDEIVAAAAPRIAAGDLETPLPDRPG